MQTTMAIANLKKILDGSGLKEIRINRKIKETPPVPPEAPHVESTGKFATKRFKPSSKVALLLAASVSIFIVGQILGALNQHVDRLSSSVAAAEGAIERLSALETTAKPASPDIQSTGRPLGILETPPMLPQTNESEFHRRWEEVTCEIDKLGSNGHVSFSFVSQKLMYDNILAAIPAQAADREARFAAMINKTRALYNQVLSTRKEQLRIAAASEPFNIPWKASAADCKLNPKLKPNHLYICELTGTSITRMIPVAQADINSFAHPDTQQPWLMANAQSLYHFNDKTMLDEEIWCPGEGAGPITGLDSITNGIIVRRGKILYTFESGSGEWRVIENSRLPEAPFATCNNPDRLFVAGRIENGRLGYLHEYDLKGVPTRTIKLERAINLGTDKPPVLYGNFDKLLIPTAAFNSNSATEKLPGYWIVSTVDGSVTWSGAYVINKEIIVEKKPKKLNPGSDK